MAGGRGERLRPITDTMPKPNLEVGGIPALGYALRMAREAGIREAAVTVQYRYEDVVDRFGEQSHGVALDYYIEDTPLGTAGSVASAVGERFYDDEFEELVVLSGDAVCDFDLRPALSEHRRRGADATLLLYSSDEPWKYGCVETERAACDDDACPIFDEDRAPVMNEDYRRITSFVEKPRDRRGRALVNTGIYILSKNAVSMIPHREYDFGRDLFPLMLERGLEMYGYEAKGYWCDIGTPETYRRASFDAAKNMIRGVTATVSPTGAIVAEDCRAGAGTRLTGCVLGRGVTIGVEVTAEDTIFCRGVTVGDGVVIGGGCVIGEGAFIPSGSRIDAGTYLPGVVKKRRETIFY